MFLLLFGLCKRIYVKFHDFSYFRFPPRDLSHVCVTFTVLFRAFAKAQISLFQTVFRTFRQRTKVH